MVTTRPCWGWCHKASQLRSSRSCREGSSHPQFPPPQSSCDGEDPDHRYVSRWLNQTLPDNAKSQEENQSGRPNQEWWWWRAASLGKEAESASLNTDLRGREGSTRYRSGGPAFLAGKELMPGPQAGWTGWGLVQGDHWDRVGRKRRNPYRLQVMLRPTGLGN